jgi:multisubunit Na+/H+ antiporter MnhB subunit
VVNSVMTQALARLLLAPILVVAVAVLIKGYADVGDGFSAGVIAAIGLLLQYLAFGQEETERRLPVSWLPAGAFAGLGLALVVAFVPLLRGDPVLTHLPPAGDEVVELGTLELITAVAFDLAVFLLVLGAVVGILHAIARTGEDGER